MTKTSIIKSFMKSPNYSLKIDSYFHVYEMLFSRFKDKKITFVEIGVLDGGSLFMWRDFLGENARIIGIDINPKAKILEASGFEIFIGDSSSPNFWQGFNSRVKNVDIVVDDGGHTYLSQLISLKMLLPHINDGGMFVTEDTHSSYMKGFGPKRFSFINFSKKKIDDINRRFNLIKSNAIENHLYSIYFFESLIVFNIDRNRAVPSNRVTNNRPRMISNGFNYKPNLKAFPKIILEIEDSINSKILRIILKPTKLFFKIIFNFRNRIILSKYFKE